jgi:hypothetical protein
LISKTCDKYNLDSSLNQPEYGLQQIVFKRATDKPLKPNAGLRPATLFVAGLLGTCCKKRLKLIYKMFNFLVLPKDFSTKIKTGCREVPTPKKETN